MAEAHKVTIGLSGGKDSIFLLLRAADRGMNPLAVCVDTGFMSPTAVYNAAVATDVLGVDCVFVQSRRDEFANIYRRHLALGTMSLLQPFDVCRECHLLIDAAIHDVALSFGCPRVWSGLSPDNAVLLPPGWTTERFESKTGTEAPLCHESYDPCRVRRFVERRIPDLNLSPLCTNCEINYLLIDTFARAHGYNPYDRFFIQHGRAAFWKWSLLEWIARKTGYVQRKARSARRRLLSGSR